MSDVQVGIGADITPFQKKMAEVRATAKETGEKFGVEFGQKAARNERRVSEGLDTMIGKLTSAKNPMDALGAAAEGIGKSFRIASSAFLGAAIGGAIASQLSIAGNAAVDFQQKFADAMSVDPADESAAGLTALEKNLEDLQAHVDKRSLLEGFIWGRGEDQQIEEATERLAMVQAAASNARTKILQDETAILGATNPQAKLAAQIDQIKDEYKQKLADASKAGASRPELQAIDDQRDAKIKAARAKTNADMNKGEQEGFDKAFKAEQDIAGEKQKQANIEREANATTSEQRISVLTDEADQIHAQAMATTDLLEKEKLLTSETEKRARIAQETRELAAKDQGTIADITKDQDDAKHAGDTEGQHIAWLKEKFDKANQLRDLGTADPHDQLQLEAMAAKAGAAYAEAMAEGKKHLTGLTAEKKAAASDLATAQADAMGFHGQVSSLRKVGFGKAPGASHGEAQLKAAQMAAQRLDTIDKNISDLNKKIGGSV